MHPNHEKTANHPTNDASSDQNITNHNFRLAFTLPFTPQGLRRRFIQLFPMFSTCFIGILSSRVTFSRFATSVSANCRFRYLAPDWLLFTSPPLVRACARACVCVRVCVHACLSFSWSSVSAVLARGVLKHLKPNTV